MRTDIRRMASPLSFPLRPIPSILSRAKARTFLEFLFRKVPPTPAIFCMCGKHGTLNPVFLEVWQGKKLRA